jgi:hypothetical protein
VLYLLLAATISVLAGCEGSTANVHNPPPPPGTTVSIAFQPAPAGSISINTTTPLSAVVSNDPNNAGVDWSLTCQNKNSGACGSLSALHTESAQATTYTPPLALAGNSQTVNIVAFATADHTQNVVAAITVTAFGASLKGTYVLQAQGIDSTSLGPYQFAGVIVLDGNGGITSGEQTVNFFDPVVGSSLSKSDLVTGGSYFLGPDGRGTMTINTNDPDIGQSGVETFSFVSLSTSQALITQTDFTDSATGTMDLQTNTAAPSGGYAFVVSGTDIASASPTAVGGIFNIDSPNIISGTGSVADQNLAGILSVNATLLGTLSNPDSSGAVTINLTPSFASGPMQFTGYIVDDTHIKLIESDNSTGWTGGVAIGQGSATGTFTDVSSFSGTYVFGVLGVDLFGFTPNTSTSLGLFTADGSGGLVNGFTDMFLQLNGNQPPNFFGAQISAAFGGTYTSGTHGTGRMHATFNQFVPAPKPAFQPVIIFYLTGNGNPALVLDGSDTGLRNYPSVGAGIAYPQSTGPLTFGGEYGFSFTQQNGGENDGTGQMTADPSAGTVSGIVDTNSGFNSTFNNSISGTFGSPLSNGRVAGTLAGQIFEFSPFNVEYYIIDPSHGFFVETDLTDPNIPTGVVSFGYYAARTPVCDGCP